MHWWHISQLTHSALHNSPAPCLCTLAAQSIRWKRAVKPLIRPDSRQSRCSPPTPTRTATRHLAHAAAVPRSCPAWLTSHMFKHPFPLRSALDPSVPPNSVGAFHPKSTHFDQPPSILLQSEVRWYALRGHTLGLPCWHCPTPAAPASSLCRTGSNFAGTPSHLRLLCSWSEGLPPSAAHCRPCLRRHGVTPPRCCGHLCKLSNVPSAGARALVVGKLWPLAFWDTPNFRFPAGDLEFSSGGVAIG